MDRWFCFLYKYAIVSAPFIDDYLFFTELSYTFIKISCSILGGYISGLYPVSFISCYLQIPHFFLYYSNFKEVLISVSFRF